MALSSISTALEALRLGRMIIVVDDAERENEGDLIISAEHVTEQQMALLIRSTSGIVFLGKILQLRQSHHRTVVIHEFCSHCAGT